jgi:hypothetical protein
LKNTLKHVLVDLTVDIGGRRYPAPPFQLVEAFLQLLKAHTGGVVRKKVVKESVSSTVIVFYCFAK